MKSNLEHPVLKRTVGFGFKNGVEKTQCCEKTLQQVQACLCVKQQKEKRVVDKMPVVWEAQQNRP